jgi:CheY-like chemotaxis protein
MKVLVADDDSGSRLVAKAVVEDAGHECIVAEDGTGGRCAVCLSREGGLLCGCSGA